MARTSRRVWVAVLLAFVAACGAPPADPPAGDPVVSSTPGTGGGTDDDSGDTGDSKKDDDGGGKDDDGDGPWLIRWLTDLGPGGPGGGEDYGWEAYRALRARDCVESLQLADAVDGDTRQALYSGASQACLAALDGETERWPDAEELLRTVEAADTANLTCYDASVRAFLKALVQMHRDDPDRSFASRGGGTVSTSCLRFLRLRPASGPRSGGYDVTVVGENLDTLGPDREIGVSNDGTTVSVPITSINDAGTRLVFEMPEVKGGQTQIGVYGNRGEAFLEFDALPDE